MKVSQSNADNWWSKATPRVKRTSREVVAIVRDLLDQEALRVTCSGEAFVPQLVSQRPWLKAIFMEDQTEDEWWAAICPEGRAWTHTIATLLQKVASDPRKALQVTNADDNLTIHLVWIDNRPVEQPSVN